MTLPVGVLNELLAELEPHVEDPVQVAYLARGYERRQLQSCELLKLVHGRALFQA